MLLAADNGQAGGKKLRSLQQTPIEKLSQIKSDAEKERGEKSPACSACDVTARQVSLSLFLSARLDFLSLSLFDVQGGKSCVNRRVLLHR